MNFNEDPFFLVQKEVQENITQIEQLFKSWLRILKGIKNLDNEEYKNTTKEIELNIDEINNYLIDLQDAINILFILFLNENREQFKIQNSELIKRQQYVLDIKKKVRDIEEAISDPESVLKGIKKKQEYSSSYSIEMEPIYTDNNNTETNNGQQLSAQNQMIIEQQDQQLDSILGTVKNLKEIANTVNQELDLHNEIIEEIDTRMDTTQDKLQSAFKKVKKIGEKVGDVKSSILIPILIAILTLLAFILFFL
ncbi:hypothetical protein K502DRAFT_367433 [Neoconidiobolus thromboides FSU 785]|nr:hypothetical protein K502DRAFT_367433 [Neoconidiobolus thromboides FSU 785]